MARYDLTDFEWKTIRPLLPNKPRGVPRVDDRRVRSRSSRDPRDLIEESTGITKHHGAHGSASR
jgi:transposase